MMIDGRKTGAFLSRLRKDRDWTQMELAERLHVTPQAVSRWETGESYPDIGLLPQIAELFDITVDELLYGGVREAQARQPKTGVVVEGLARGDTARVADLLRSDEDSRETLIDVAPLARPSAVNNVVAALGGAVFTPDQIARLAPFLGEEQLEKIVLEANLETVEWEYISHMAPFLSAETLDRLVQKLPQKGVEAGWLSSLAPFLSHASLERLVDQVIEGSLSLNQLAGLAPFLSANTLDRLIARLPETNFDAEYLTMLAPFARTETLERLVGQVLEGTLSADHLSGLAPFLSADALDRLMDGLPDSAIESGLVPQLAPFVHSATLERLIHRLEGPLQAETLQSVAPFLGGEVLARLVQQGGGLDAETIVNLAPFLDRESLAAAIRGSVRQGSE